MKRLATALLSSLILFSLTGTAYAEEAAAGGGEGGENAAAKKEKAPPPAKKKAPEQKPSLFGPPSESPRNPLDMKLVKLNLTKDNHVASGIQFFNIRNFAQASEEFKRALSYSKGDVYVSTWLNASLNSKKIEEVEAQKQLAAQKKAEEIEAQKKAEEERKAMEAEAARKAAEEKKNQKETERNKNSSSGKKKSFSENDLKGMSYQTVLTNIKNGNIREDDLQKIKDQKFKEKITSLFRSVMKK